MPEPDFDQIARALWTGTLAQTTPPDTWADEFARTFGEQLRQVWNASGAADRVAVADLMLMQPRNICEPIQYTIGKLDR